MRSCEICQCDSKIILHQQAFFFPGIENELAYKVVSCSHCGFAYADEIPNQTELNAFYKSMEHHLNSVSLPAGLAWMHSSFFDFVKENIPNIAQASVLDIGSSMGHFLNHFKIAGIEKILGLEPSQEAKEMAKTHYDIEVISTSFSEYITNEKFNLITLSGVLEHIESLDSAIKKINHLLDYEGHVFVAVPDAGKFDSRALREPFLEFAFEHINFFSKTSLENIFSNYDFELIKSLSLYNDFYDNNALLALFKKIPFKPNQLQFDVEGYRSVKQYINNSNELLIEINKKITQLFLSQEPLIVWGTGAYTTRLCTTTLLGQTNLIGFVDKNPQNHGKRLLGRTVFAPSWIDDYKNETILIASSVYADEIEEELLKKYRWQGKIVRLGDM